MTRGDRAGDGRPGGGWGLAPAGQSLLLVVGGITRKPAVIADPASSRG